MELNERDDAVREECLQLMSLNWVLWGVYRGLGQGEGKRKGRD